MFKYKREYRTEQVVPDFPLFEVYDEKMVFDGVSISYKMKTRELTDEFEYKDEKYCFCFSGFWEEDVYIVTVGSGLNEAERVSGDRLTPDYVLTAIRNIEAALLSWPIDGRIYKTVRVNIITPIENIEFYMSLWRSWQASGLADKIDNWR